jgi:hypothetical protein
MNLAPTRTLCAASLALALMGCGVTEPDAAPASLDRVWRATEAGVEETTIELRPDGAARFVDSDFSRFSCASSPGAWTSDGSRLVLRLTPPGGAAQSDVRSFDYEVFQDSLVLTSGGASTTFIPGTRVPSCVSYGFGTWEGTLSARIDGVPQTFENISVETGAIAAGTVVILACPDAATLCGDQNAMLVLRINSPAGPLTPGNYTLGDISAGFYGLINPFPDDPDFPGFDSLRLLPTGAFQLSLVSEDWVFGTFEFRANERASNAPPAPDGRTFVLVTDGLVDLRYR